MASKFIVFCSLLAIAKAAPGVLTPIRYTATPAGAVAYANPAVDAVASTQQNVVRSFGGTVSTYSKAIDTPYSSVRKADTRISNNVYTPAIAKTLAYAPVAPAVTKTISYAPTAPVTKTITTYAAAPAAPVIEKTVGLAAYASPAAAALVTKTLSAPVVASQTYYKPAVAAYAQHYPAAPAPAADLYTHAVPKAHYATISNVAKPIVSYAAPVAVAPVATTTYNHGPAATTYTHNAPGVSGYGSSQTVHYSPANMVSHMSFDGFGTHWGY